MNSKIVLCFALLIAVTMQWPCHDWGYNGPIANCQSCNILGNNWGLPGSTTGQYWFSVCTQCTAGFFLNASACMNCTPGCTQCTYNGACKPNQCAPGFAFLSTNYTCVPCPSSLNCLQCQYQTQPAGASYNLAQFVGTGPFVCTACPSNNYYISSTGQCTACSDPNCNAGGGLNFASQTSQSAWAWGGNSITGICSSTGCKSCASGYYLTSTGTCTACTANCVSCASTGCITCASNSFATGTTPAITACTLCTAGCTSCTSAASCTTCQTGYTGSGTATCTIVTPNCNTLTSGTTGTCSGCATGYWPSAASSATCTACATNCTACTPNAGYTAATCNSGSCAALNVYYSGACYPLPANCTAGTINSAGTAALCTTCQTNYTISNGACYPCAPNCISCAVNGTNTGAPICLQCLLGFGLSDSSGQCIPCPPGCDYCDGNGICTQCRQANWAGGFVVPQVPTGTNYWNATNVTQGWVLAPNQCQQCPYNCTMCVNSTFCINNCTKGYNFTASATVTLANGPMAMNASIGLCLPLGAERIVLAGFALLSVLFYFI